jgi:hypothetical protein
VQEGNFKIVGGLSILSFVASRRFAARRFASHRASAQLASPRRISLQLDATHRFFDTAQEESFKIAGGLPTLSFAAQLAAAHRSSSRRSAPLLSASRCPAPRRVASQSFTLTLQNFEIVGELRDLNRSTHRRSARRAAARRNSPLRSAPQRTSTHRIVF